MDDATPDIERRRWWHSPLVGWLVGALFGVWYLTAGALMGLAAVAWYLLDWTTVGVVMATAAVIIFVVNFLL